MLKVANLAGAVNIEATMKISQRRGMGIQLPVVETSLSEHPPYYSPLGKK